MSKETLQSSINRILTENPSRGFTCSELADRIGAPEPSVRRAIGQLRKHKQFRPTFGTFTVEHYDTLGQRKLYCAAKTEQVNTTVKVDSAPAGDGSFGTPKLPDAEPAKPLSDLADDRVTGEARYV